MHFFCGFGLCLALGLTAIRLAPWLGLLDVPGGRRRHGAPVPKVGGLAVLLTLLPVLGLTGLKPLVPPLPAALVLGMGLVGLLDDFRDLRPRWKALSGLAVALVLGGAALGGMARAPVAVAWLWFQLPLLPWLIFPLLVLMFWCLPQAFNLIDGANGLATGYGLIVVACLWASGSPQPVLGGALLACFVLNWPRPRLFLGDCGSLSVGLLLVLIAQNTFLPHAPNAMLWLFAYPTVDVLLVLFIRTANRRPVFYGDRNHLHYQIMDRWPRLAPWAVPLLLVIAALCGSATWLRGAWMLLPFLGLAGLLGLAGYFAATSVAVSRALAGDFQAKPSE